MGTIVNFYETGDGTGDVSYIEACISHVSGHLTLTLKNFLIDGITKVRFFFYPSIHCTKCEFFVCFFFLFT